MLPTLPPARRKMLLWIALGSIVLLVLAAGLGTFSFQPGRNFQMPAGEGDTPGSSNGELFGGELVWAILRGMFALMLLGLPLFILVSLFSKEGRRRLLYYTIVTVLLFLVMNQVQNMPRTPRGTPTPEAMANPAQPLSPLAGGEELPPGPGQPSDALVTAVSFLLVVIVLALVAWLGRRWLTRELPPLAQIANEADKARRDLAGGGNVEDVVVRCYRQMSRIVAEAREIRRAKSATPREFEEELEKSGLPGAPVRALTQLFEDVRYGGLAPGPAERQAAIHSLEAIAAACRAEMEKKKKKEQEKERARA